MAVNSDIIRRGSVLTTLLIINCVIFLLLALAMIGDKAGFRGTITLLELLVLPADTPAWLHRPWTLLTYMVSQRDFLHLLFNMLWMLWFGSILLHRLSQRQVLWLYICGGLCGGLFFLLAGAFMPGLCPHGSFLLGSSASVLAIMASAAICMPDYPLHLFFIGDVKLKWIAIVMILLAFIGLGGGNSGGEVAHIGGVCFGALQGLLVRKGIDIFRPFQSRGAASRRRRCPSALRMGKGGQTERLDAMDKIRSERARLDELLEKISRSGYNSLSEKERQELEKLSRNV